MRIIHTFSFFFITRSGIKEFDVMDGDEMHRLTGPGPHKCEIFLFRLFAGALCLMSVRSSMLF